MNVLVLTDRDALLQRLQAVCGDIEFTRDPSKATGVVIVDGEGEGERGAKRAPEVPRIILGDSDGAPRRFGEIRLSEEAFFASPQEYVGFAADLFATIRKVSEAEQELELVAHVRELVTASDAASVFSNVIHTLTDLLAVPRGTMLLHDPTLERFVCAATTDGSWHDSEAFLPPDLAAALGRSGEARFVVYEQARGGRAVAIPVLAQDDIIGIFVATVAGDPEPWRMARVLTYVAAVTGVIANLHQLIHSRELALRDDLTKAFNRRFFESYLDEEMERTRRYGSLFSIIFLDLDDLKVVNSMHGHLVGSRVLQEVARRVLAAVRTIDKVVRFGGDEFCVILPQTDQEQARNVAARIRRSLVEATFSVEPGTEVPISASFGIATYPVHATTKEELIRQADAAMYRVKSTTKNAIGAAGEVGSSRAGSVVS